MRRFIESAMVATNSEDPVALEFGHSVLEPVVEGESFGDAAARMEDVGTRSQLRFDLEDSRLEVQGHEDI